MTLNLRILREFYFHYIGVIDACKADTELKTAVLKEILRVSNPLPGRLPRVVPPEGFKLDGVVIQPGVRHTQRSAINTVADHAVYLTGHHTHFSLSLEPPQISMGSIKQ